MVDEGVSCGSSVSTLGSSHNYLRKGVKSLPPDTERRTQDHFNILFAEVMRDNAGGIAKSVIVCYAQTVSTAFSDRSTLTEETGPPKQKSKPIDSAMPLDFEPAAKLPVYVPETLMVPADGPMELPIYLHGGEKSLKIHCDYHPGAIAENFWKHVAKVAKQFGEKNYPDFVPLQELDLQQLKVGGATVPRLLGIDGRLHYHFETRHKKINKSQLKNYLRTINVNVATLIQVMFKTLTTLTTGIHYLTISETYAFISPILFGIQLKHTAAIEIESVTGVGSYRTGAEILLVRWITVELPMKRRQLSRCSRVYPISGPPISIQL